MENMGKEEYINKKIETEIKPEFLSIATATYYKNWYSGEINGEENKIDKVRGDLAIQMIQEAVSKGFHISVVDGGSSDAFRDRLSQLDIKFENEKEKGMSAGRRQALEMASEFEDAKVVCWTEPEKISIINDCLPEATIPILTDEADIIIPKRDEQAFKTYPSQQAAYEQKANKLWNEILKKHSLLSEDAEDLDVWIGPRFIKNDKEILQLFLDKYEFQKRDLKVDDIVEPELWPNALFLPIIAALKKGLRVKSVDVEYRHPTEQTQSEENNETFNRKRDIQLKNIIITTMHFIRMLENNPKSRLFKKDANK